jgi:hypothetical protein
MARGLALLPLAALAVRAVLFLLRALAVAAARLRFALVGATFQAVGQPSIIPRQLVQQASFSPAGFGFAASAVLLTEEPYFL